VLELEIPPEDSGAKYARPGPENGIYRDRPAPAGTGLPPILLFQALPKGNKMDLIVRQAAEGGISEVIPFTADHSVPEGSSRGREERWRRIAREARQQSGSAVDTRVSSPLSAGALFDRWNTLEPGALGLVLHPPLAQGSFHHYLYRDPSLIVLAVGPEGGFSAAELTRFTNAGFKSLCLGDTVLRTETAALYGAAAVRIILLEKAWWTLK
jgi:16S rRNA (uracil1498-N3)-methyltransferase